MRKSLLLLACVALIGACASMKKGTWKADGATAAAPSTGTLKTNWGWIKATAQKVDGDGFHVALEMKNTSGKPFEYVRKHVALVDAAGQSHADLADKYLAENATDAGLNVATSGWSLRSITSAAKTAVQATKAVTRNGTIAAGATHTDDLTFDAGSAWGSFSIQFAKELVGEAKNNQIKFNFEEQK